LTDYYRRSGGFRFECRDLPAEIEARGGRTSEATHLLSRPRPLRLVIMATDAPALVAHGKTLFGCTVLEGHHGNPFR